MSIDRLIGKGLLERVDADPEAATAALVESRRHLTSARVIAADDPNGAYQLLYDAARKAITAHMSAYGYRVPKGRPGAHETTARYAKTEIAATDSVAQFDRMRRNRNRSEYEIKFFGEAEVQADLKHAEAIVSTVEKGLGLSGEEEG